MPGNFTLIETSGTARRGFTLIELLVVVTIIVLLLAMLTPSLETAVAQARLARCLANQAGIHVAMHGYLTDNMGSLFDKRQRHRWHPGDTHTPDMTRWIDYRSGIAYWGAAYRLHGAVKKMFNCPDATDAQSDFDVSWNNWSDGSWADGHVYTTYGLNGIDLNRAGTANDEVSPFFNGAVAVKYSQWVAPASKILVMDFFESLPEGGTDMPYLMTQSEWLGRPSADQQHYVHLRGSAMMWGDGHVSHHQPEFGWEIGDVTGDFDRRWFTVEGGIP